MLLITYIKENPVYDIIIIFWNSPPNRSADITTQSTNHFVERVPEI